MVSIHSSGTAQFWLHGLIQIPQLHKQVLDETRIATGFDEAVLCISLSTWLHCRKVPPWNVS